MQIPFVKFQGTGNDFVMIDKSQLSRKLTDIEIQTFCDRHFGVGSDGLIIVGASEKAEVDFEMDFYNPDASKSFCGNGSRCAVKFAQSLGLIDSTCIFEAIDGLHTGSIEDNRVSILMRPTSTFEAISKNEYFIHTGSPHHILWTSGVVDFDLIAHGRKVRYSETYKPGGTNVNIAEQLEGNVILMRTYERGVEDETLSCGTGVTAVALAAAHKFKIENEVIVKTKGGELQVSFQTEDFNSFEDIYLKGPAERVFEGVFNF